jgi:hypothetical protein
MNLFFNGRLFVLLKRKIVYASATELERLGIVPGFLPSAIVPRSQVPYAEARRYFFSFQEINFIIRYSLFNILYSILPHIKKAPVSKYQSFYPSPLPPPYS